jgi:hypothetical protein
MKLEDYLSSLEQSNAPVDCSPYLTALWHDHRGDWARAHEIVQEIADPSAAWVHAYLHRKEGDLSNAKYWYSQAGRRVHSGSFEEEWAEIVEELI